MKVLCSSSIACAASCLCLLVSCAGSEGGGDLDSVDAGSGNGVASGTIDSRAFDVVADSWWIGTPDDPARTRVIYVFDKPVTCAQISKTGWDTVVSDKTQSLEFKLIGTKPSNYPVAANGMPATGEASVNYTLTARTGTPAETAAKSGSVTLDTLTRAAADGSFALMFGAQKLSGHFHAIYCKDGHEP